MKKLLALSLIILNTTVYADSNKQITAYEVVRGPGNAATLPLFLSALAIELDKGWQPFGEMQIEAGGWYQAMVKYSGNVVNRKIVNYEFIDMPVNASDLDRFIFNMQYNINQGWEPLGDIQMVGGARRQAMVKYKVIGQNDYIHTGD